MKMLHEKPYENVIQYNADGDKQKIPEELNAAMKNGPWKTTWRININPVGKLTRKEMIKAAICGLKDIKPRCKISLCKI